MTKKWFCRVGIVLLANLSINQVVFAGAALPNNVTDPVQAAYNCNLPAPTGLQATNITSSSVSIQWSPVIGASGYLVTVVDAATQAPLYSNSVTGTTETCGPLPAGTLVDIYVTPLCANGIASANSASLQVSTNIVIEIVYNGYQGCNGGSSSTFVGSGPGTSFSVSVQKSRIYDCVVTNPATNQSSRFDLLVEPPNFGKQAPTIMHPTTRDLGTIYKLMNPAGEGILSATPSNGTVCQMAVSAPNPQGFYTLSVKNLLLNHTFTITGCSTGKPNPLRSDGSEGLSPASLKVAPNPVTNQVRLHFPVMEGPLPTPSRVQLYQLDGKIVLDQEVTPDDQGNVDIYLEHIKSGFYVIRVQNVKGLFTQKISKVD